MSTNKSEGVPFTSENERVSKKKRILGDYFTAILVFLQLCGTIILFCICMIKLNNSESKIIKIIKNTTNIASDAKFITDKLINGVLEENSTTREFENNLKIINRTEWGAADSDCQLIRLNTPVSTVIIAHTETLECPDFESCKLQMNLLQLFYKQLRNFEDIGYNFLIGGDGAVYEGIGWDYIGQHTIGHNNNSIGIGFIGNYQNREPTDQQVNATILLMNYGLENNYLDKNYVIKGQRDFLPIVSPGQNLYNRMMAWSHFFKN